ncbi:MAG: EAL domain-containing protein [Cyanobacteria bacterium P01_F01_bin.4]
MKFSLTDTADRHQDTASHQAAATPTGQVRPPSNGHHPGNALNTKTLKQIFQLSPIGMTMLDLDGHFLSANQAFCNAIGCLEPDLLTRSFGEFTHPEDVSLLRALGDELLQNSRQHFQIETRHWNANQDPLQVSLTGTLVRDSHQRPLCFLIQVVDLTERKWMEAQLKHHAFYDLLTGLANRFLFINRLEQALVRLDRHRDEQCAILFLDLDRFKAINENLGHTIGDQLLVALAKRLESCIRRCDTLARLGGDEFAILLEDIAGLEDVTTVCDRIQAVLKTPFKLSNQEVFSSISVGVICTTNATNFTKSASDLLRSVDTALSRAKAQGGACHTIFEETMHQRAAALWEIANQSQLAIERQELNLRYQPIIRLATGETVGFEALLRWNHPQHGSISPAEFIPVMEETGVITTIGHWVLQEACHQVCRWQAEFQDMPLSININVSPKQFAHPQLVEQVETVLQETCLAPEQIRLEITENAVMQSLELAKEVLHRLKQLNVSICIDDFGVGYSSLSRLQQLPIDTLKIDRSFIQSINAAGENIEIPRSIIDLASNLGIDVVAEGVETATQLHQLQSLGCPKVQGFYFAKPLTPDAALRFARETQAKPHPY